MSCRQQCGTCAFRVGAAANREPYNNLRAKIAALGLIPFFCHEGWDWRSAHSKFPPGAPRKVCAGWQSAIRDLQRRGFFRSGRMWRKAVGTIAMDHVELFVAAKSGAEKARHKARILHFLELLTQKTFKARRPA